MCFMSVFLGLLKERVPEDMPDEEQPEVEELDEILVPEQILAHKDRKVKGKVARRYLVKFRNYSPMDAKWMEESELTQSPLVLQLYLEAFQLQPTLTFLRSDLEEQRSRALSHAQEGGSGDASTSHVQTLLMS